MSATVPTAISVDEAGAVLTIVRHGRTPLRAHAMWLRDRCECGDCRRSTTNERLLDQAALDPTTVIREASLSDSDDLMIVFSDGHRWISGVGDVAVQIDPESDGPMGGRTRWPIGSFATFARSDLRDDVAVLEMLDRFIADGAVVVTGVEPSESGLRDTAGLIGQIQMTNYGPTWSFEASVDPVSEVESMHMLRMHTDLPYREQPAGVQLNLAISISSAGGASTFVDGYSMAEILREENPRAWDLLTSVHFEYPYLRSKVRLRGGGPLVGLDDAGHYGIVRRAPDLVGTPRVAAQDTADLYAAVRRWGEIVDDPANQIHVGLRPGELVIFDNHRLLHGRTAFTLQPGERRHLMGCYLEMDELRNTISVLRAASGGETR